MTARQAAQAALQDQAAALLVDVAGPVLFVVEGDDLISLAAGWLTRSMGGGELAEAAAREWSGTLVLTDRSCPPGRG